MSTTASTQEVEEIVVEALTSFGADPDQIDQQATLESLDIDSLDIAELSQIVNERFGVEMKSSDVAELKTVGDAVALIHSRI
jgi:acyl carrier protein